LTLTFSQLAGNRPVWEKGLEGWNVIKSPYLEELREQVRADAEAKGEVVGRLKSLRETLLELGRQKLNKLATKKQRSELEAITDLPRLERMRDRLFNATSWTDLLSTP